MPKSGLSVALLLAVSGILGLSGCGQDSGTEQGAPSSPTELAKDTKPARKAPATSSIAVDPDTQVPPVQWDEFPFMTSNDRVVAIVRPSLLSESATLRNALDLLPFNKSDLPISPADTDWVAIYAAPLVDDNDDLTGDVTLVVKLNRPSSVTEIAESRFATDQFETVADDGLTYLRVSGLTRESAEQPAEADGKTNGVVNVETEPDMAVYEYDEMTYVVCEEGRLKFVLDRSDIDSPLRLLMQHVDRKSSMCIGVCFQDRPLLSAALQTQATKMPGDVLLKTLAANVQSVVASCDLDGETLVNLSLTSSAEDQAVAIEQAVQNAVGSGETSLQALGSDADDTTQQLVKTGQQLLEGIQVARQNMTVEVVVANPGNLPQFFKSLASLVSQTGASP